MKCFVEIIFALFLAFTFSTTSAYENCPDTFVTINGRCIFIARDALDLNLSPRTWDESRDLCTSMSNDYNTLTTDLAAVDVDFLEAFTKHIVAHVPGLKFYIFFTGASLVNGQWSWIDGTPISNTSYIWVRNAPKFKHQTGRGMLVPAGASNRFYLEEYAAEAKGPSYLCEAKRIA